MIMTGIKKNKEDRLEDALNLQLHEAGRTALSPVDQRIQDFLNDYLKKTGRSGCRFARSFSTAPDWAGSYHFRPTAMFSSRTS
jgi:hypothetical protein